MEKMHIKRELKKFSSIFNISLLIVINKSSPSFLATLLHYRVEENIQNPVTDNLFFVDTKYMAEPIINLE